MIHAGRLRHRIVIQEAYYEQDAKTGDVTPNWKLVAKVWAEIKALSAKDLIAAQAAQSKIIARITVRHRTDMHAGMRVVHGSTIYTIEGILPDPDSGLEYFTLTCSAGVKA